MIFEKLEKSVIKSHEIGFAGEVKTKIETQINGTWKHDCNDSNKPIK